MGLWVVDTSPLVYLAKLDRLDLLERMPAKVVVPPAVIAEVREQPDEAAAKIEDACSRWLSVVPIVESRSQIQILELELGPGETEVLVLARELGAGRVVLDDLEARRWARRLGLEIVGTLGLLLAARLRGEIPSLTQEIDRLLEHGFRVSENLRQELIEAAGERRPG